MSKRLKKKNLKTRISSVYQKFYKVIMDNHLTKVSILVYLILSLIKVISKFKAHIMKDLKKKVLLNKIYFCYMNYKVFVSIIHIDLAK